MNLLLLFISGAAVGSFLNVVALRYNPEKFLLSHEVIGGRSRCPKCGVTLRWFELVPILSFLLQRGHCNECGAGISARYPLIEIVSGLIFVFVPLSLSSPYLQPATYYILSSVWISVFLTLLLISLVDFRLNIIPDEANIFLGILGVATLIFARMEFGQVTESFLGPYALIFGLQSNVWVNHLFAVVVAVVVFGSLIALTRGRGMGMGDLKLSIPLGFIFGWPDIVLIIGIGFVLGAVIGGYSIIFKKKTMKSTLPFGPFLALASVIVFFFGRELLDFYFKLFILL